MTNAPPLSGEALWVYLNQIAVKLDDLGAFVEADPSGNPTLRLVSMSRFKSINIQATGVFTPDDYAAMIRMTYGPR